MTKKKETSSKQTSHKNPSEDIYTIDVQPFLLPIAILISSLILSFAMIISAGRIGRISENTNSGDKEIINEPQNNGEDTTVGNTSIDDDAVKGNKDKAKVAIVEFSDYSCPFCSKFYQNTLPKIQDNFIKNDKAVFVYRDLPLSFHEYAQIQAEAAECAGEEGEDMYYAMHDRIFEELINKQTEMQKLTQEEYENLSDEQMLEYQVHGDILKELAKELKLDTSKFNKCLDEGLMKSEVEADAKDANATGINGTPGFVVGILNEDGSVEGEVISGAQPYESFEKAINNYL
ncbi:thioredoxin domain-containing protein [Candidatus Dojkabacteria bacterium]|nr:thioredoxin domain-containing protein [Candidatus Dojkabacteria bacterium]